MNWLTQMKIGEKLLIRNIKLHQDNGNGSSVMEEKAQLLTLKHKIELHKQKIVETQILKSLLTNQKARLLDRELRRKP